MADLLLSCRDRASFCSSIWSNLAKAPSDLHLVAEDGVVGAHIGMLLSQSRQLADIIKTVPHSTDPIQVVLAGASVKAVTAAKELVCAGSCVLDEAIIAEVLQIVGILGIEVSANNFCFDNGAIIIPSLNCGVDGQVLESDVKESQEKTCSVSMKAEDVEIPCRENASPPSHAKSLEYISKNQRSEAKEMTKDLLKVKEIVPIRKEKETNAKNVSFPQKAMPIEEKMHQCNICYSMFVHEKDMYQHISAAHHRKFSASVCIGRLRNSKKFREVDVVTKPIKAHRKERQCDVCSNKFSDRRSREEHIRTMHPNTLHKCGYCLKEFLKENSLVQHTKSAHPDALLAGKE